MNGLSKLALATVFTFSSGAMAIAQDAPHAHANHGAAKAAAGDMVDGEVRKVDKESGKITLRHGELKNLGMPPMTMAFRAKDAAMLDQVKTGDKVKFAAERVNGAITVVHLEGAK